MKLFELNCDLDLPSCDVSYPMLPDGTGFHDDDAPEPYDVDQVVVHMEEDGPINDRILLFGYHLVVLEDAKAVLEQFAPSDYLRFVPTFILGKNGEHVADAFFACEKHSISAINYDESECEFWIYNPSLPESFRTIERRVKYVKAWVFDEAKLPPFGIFRTPHSNWIASDDVKAAVEDAGMTGFRFDFLWESWTN